MLAACGRRRFPPRQKLHARVLDVDTFRPPGLACLSFAVTVGIAIAMSMVVFELEVSATLEMVSPSRILLVSLTGW